MALVATGLDTTTYPATFTTFNGRLRGRARDFNWHNVVGFWSAIPLVVIVLGASVISYPWATDIDLSPGW